MRLANDIIDTSASDASNRQIHYKKRVEIVCLPYEGWMLILTITKHYFDLISSGDKTIEYRKSIPYYDKKFKEPVSAISFHYRKRIYLDCEIDKIVKIKRPKELKNSVFITTRYCYAIHIKSCVVRT